jgi:hypothetical protein
VLVLAFVAGSSGSADAVGTGATSTVGGGTLGLAGAGWAAEQPSSVPSTGSSSLHRKVSSSPRANKSHWYHARVIRAASAVLAASWLAVACPACAPQPVERPRFATRAPQRPRPVWSRLAEVSGWPPLNTVPFPARGHDGSPRFAVVRVSPEARRTYLELVPDSTFPDGALIALFQQSPDGYEKGPTYVMEKRSGHWSFASYAANGERLPSSAETCAACHADAPADGVFGLPRWPINDRGE